MNKWILQVLMLADCLSAVLTWNWAQEHTKGKLTCIIDGQVFIQPANGVARSSPAGAGPSKISVVTEAVAIGYWNTQPGMFGLMGSRCFYFVHLNTFKCHYTVNHIFMFVIFLICFCILCAAAFGWLQLQIRLLYFFTSNGYITNPRHYCSQLLLYICVYDHLYLILFCKCVLPTARFEHVFGKFTFQKGHLP